VFRIIKLLIGEKIEVEISELGIFNARIRNINKENIVWTGSISYNKSNQDLVILLLGDSKGPYKSQIEDTKIILKDLESINNQIIEIVNKDYSLKEKFKNQRITDFYLACINPWLKNEISYELSFESKINDGYIGAIFKKGKISEVNV
jgi:hypothetical protein